MAGAATALGFTLEPLDTLFFRDGRAFDASARAISGLPNPQSLTGAIRTWLMREAGCDFERIGQSVRGGRTPREAALEQGEAIGAIFDCTIRGPWLARDGAPLVPAPAILQRLDASGEIVRLVPLRKAPPGWKPQLPGMAPLWLKHRGKAEPLSGFLSLAGLAAFLRGGVPAIHDVVADRDLFATDHRTGIAIDGGTQTTREGLIYGTGMLALRPGISFYVELAGWKGSRGLTVPAIIPWGGEGRHVVLRRLARPIAWPSVECSRSREERPLLLLTSPAPFDSAWRPSWMSPVAAAVPGAVAVSGWDLARGGPKPNRFAAAAGSTYFLSDPMAPPRVPGSLCGGEDACSGWGTYVEGVWTYG